MSLPNWRSAQSFIANSFTSTLSTKMVESVTWDTAASLELRLSTDECLILVFSAKWYPLAGPVTTYLSNLRDPSIVFLDLCESYELAR
jgi:hypothetical protein